VRLKSDVVALQMHAERTGWAWACPFASSAEFEAAVISAKRRDGVYGPKRLRRYMLYAAAAMGVVAAIMLSAL